MSSGQPNEATCRHSHGFLRSQAKCPDCDYRAPMDGPDRIVAALDRLTAAVDRLNDAYRGLSTFPVE